MNSLFICATVWVLCFVGKTTEGMGGWEMSGTAGVWVGNSQSQRNIYTWLWLLSFLKNKESIQLRKQFSTQTDKIFDLSTI